MTKSQRLEELGYFSLGIITCFAAFWLAHRTGQLEVCAPTVSAAVYERTQALQDERIAQLETIGQFKDARLAAKGERVKALEVKLADAVTLDAVAAEVRDIKALAAKLTPMETQAKYDASFLGIPLDVPKLKERMVQFILRGR